MYIESYVLSSKEDYLRGWVGETGRDKGRLSSHYHLQIAVSCSHSLLMVIVWQNLLSHGNGTDKTPILEGIKTSV